MASFAQVPAAPTLGSVQLSDALQQQQQQEQPMQARMQAILDAHNCERAKHGLELLNWDAQLAASAAKTASRCVFAHEGGHDYGENLAVSSGAPVSAGGWIDERQFWNCAAGANQACRQRNAGLETCGHLTQMLWSPDTQNASQKTTKVGCAIQVCPNGLVNFSRPNSEFLVCHYENPGNWQGLATMPPQNCALRAVDCSQARALGWPTVGDVPTQPAPPNDAEQQAPSAPAAPLPALESIVDPETGVQIYFVPSQRRQIETLSATQLMQLAAQVANVDRINHPFIVASFLQSLLRAAPAPPPAENAEASNADSCANPEPIMPVQVYAQDQILAEQLSAAQKRALYERLRCVTSQQQANVVRQFLIELEQARVRQSAQEQAPRPNNSGAEPPRTAQMMAEDTPDVAVAVTPPPSTMQRGAQTTPDGVAAFPTQPVGDMPFMAVPQPDAAQATLQTVLWIALVALIVIIAVMAAVTAAVLLKRKQRNRAASERYNF